MFWRMSWLVSITTLLVMAQLVSPATAQVGMPQPYGAAPLQYGAPNGGPQPYGAPQPNGAPQPYGAPQAYDSSTPPMPDAPWVYSSQPTVYGGPSGYPSAYGGSLFMIAPMPGASPAWGVWSWPAQGAFWPAGTQEIVLPDWRQTQPLTPGIPPQSQLPEFVPRVDVPMPKVPGGPPLRSFRSNESLHQFPPLSQ
jgi:hypothetical protein